ncbi:hypothetical protein NBRC116601_07760 [Cognatishimia sp. WU-CL00825]|uniref:DUF2059 domain-containing protein n=1 Tax=Cognatishimia sp. WU-CL00825 TaxID=3127658 RepID=UPI00310AF5F5
MFARYLKSARLAIVLGGGIVVGAAQAFAAERADVESFLKVTGFDVAIESIALGAEDAPSMLGLEQDAFGKRWRQLSEEIFVPAQMLQQATDMLAEALAQDLLKHAIQFYESDLGTRLVAAENLSHMDDPDLKHIAGREIIAQMVQKGDAKIGFFQRMNVAIDPEDLGLRAVQEIQVRFLVAASRAGVIERDLDEAMLWAQIRETEAEVRRSMQAAALTGSAYTYQGFSEDELETYTEALEDPKMQKVYELMNAVHFRIMGDRFDALAQRLDALRPSQEL